jgi:DNA polymerase III epsilon subunit-like protein
MNIYLDTETTGLDESSEVIQLGIIDDKGNVLINTLIQCKGDMSKHASYIHGITKKDLHNAPYWPEIYSKFLNIIGKADKVYIYNSEFNIKLLNQTLDLYKLKMPEIKAVCIMNLYANKFNNGYRRKLLDACNDFFVNTCNIKLHTAIGDCELTRRLHAQMLIEIAEEKQEREKKHKARIRRKKTKAKKLANVPKNWKEYPDFGQVNRPDGYKTLSSIALKEMHKYKFAGSCCNTYGGAGFLFKPK